MLQGRRFQVQVLKPCNSIQETSEAVLDFKARQLAQYIASNLCIDVWAFFPYNPKHI